MNVLTLPPFPPKVISQKYYLQTPDGWSLMFAVVSIGGSQVSLTPALYYRWSLAMHAPSMFL